MSLTAKRKTHLRGRNREREGMSKKDKEGRGWKLEEIERESVMLKGRNCVLNKKFCIYSR